MYEVSFEMFCGSSRHQAKFYALEQLCNPILINSKHMNKIYHYRT